MTDQPTNQQPQAPDYGEPWENGLYPNDIGDRYGHKVAQIGSKKIKHKDRIIACVNACAGIPNEILTKVGIQPKRSLNYD